MKQMIYEKKKPTPGQLVHIMIDRPMNSYHPEHKELFYTVNYGYIEGIIAPDGEEQDVYVLGIDHPVKEFTGKVIAIIHRLNDVEDKWVAVPEDMTMTAQEIKEQVRFQEQAELRRPGRLGLMAGLFVLCLLSVFRVLPYPALLAVVAGGLLLFDRGLFRRVDYGLLATFFCFFLFAGNIGACGPVHAALASLMEGHTALTTGLTSQIISNVPAAVLLSGFTADWRGLLVGSNLGGLGTPIASLASLISLKVYLRTPGARPGRYLLLFTAANGAALVLLCLCAALLAG